MVCSGLTRRSLSCERFNPRSKAERARSLAEKRASKLSHIATNASIYLN